MMSVTLITFSLSLFVITNFFKKGNKVMLKIFENIIFPNYCGHIENIFSPNNLLFTTLPLKLVNKYQLFSTCLQDPVIFPKIAL